MRTDVAVLLALFVVNAGEMAFDTTLVSIILGLVLIVHTPICGYAYSHLWVSHPPT